VTCWEPAADIYEIDAGWLIKFDLSGVRPEDVRVTFHEGRLTVAGVRRDYARTTGARYYRMEIAYNSFQRTIELPGAVDASQISSKFQDGMLLVEMRGRK
jgi:HSP20 family protein